MKTPQVIVVGAGIGGLIAAVELAHAGYAVRVFEAQESVGGKLRQITFEGNEGIDSGPTVFTMKWVFDDFFESIDETLSGHLFLEPLNLLARHAWASGGNLDLFADEQRSADAIGRLSGAAEAHRYRAFCATSRKVFETLDATFMRASRPSINQLTWRIACSNPVGLTAVHPFRSLWAELGRYFHDPRLRQLFGRYATYCGSSPFEAPGTLMLVAHAEQKGVWLVRGGMRQLATALGNLAERKGAVIRCSAPVDDILADGGRVCGVRLRDGEEFYADAVLFNGDANALGRGLLGAASQDRALCSTRAQRSQSAVTWSMIAGADGYDLAPHTVFFSEDYASEFDDVFAHRRVPRTPTVYVHAPDRAADGRPATKGQERIFCLVNAPANGDETQAPEEIEQCQENMLHLMRRCGLNLRWRPEQVRRTTPSDFEALFPATGGALYGRASHGWRSSFQRPASRTKLPGLYLTGGSVHPGPGVPMAALSGRLAANCLMADYRSQHRSHPGAIIGGMSTA